MPTLGEKIKELRKQLKMTQTQLCDGELTKSMLSQIESNKAMPSMKTIQHISYRLGKPVSYFIDDLVEREAERVSTEAINRQLKDISQMMDRYDFQTSKVRLEELLKAYPVNMHSKLYAEIGSKLGECLINLNMFSEGEEKIKAAIEIFLSHQLYVQAAKSHFRLIRRHIGRFDYEECQVIIDKALEIYNLSAGRDYYLETEIIYYHAMVLSATGNIQGALERLKDAISTAKESNVYYKTDMVYRLIASLNFYLENYDEFNYNIKKAAQFAEFTENTANLGLIEISNAIYQNEMKNGDKALEHLHLVEKYHNHRDSAYYFESSKAFYYIGEFEKARECMQKVSFPEFIPHRIDIHYYLSAKIFEGLILYKLGNIEESIVVLTEGIKRMEGISHTRQLVFAYKSLSEVYSSIQDYQNAFVALKKADEVKDSL